MFPSAELVRSVQTELDTVIEEGVANIVQLLKNSESGVSSGAARFSDDDAFEAKNMSFRRFRQWVHDDGKLLPSSSSSSDRWGGDGRGDGGGGGGRKKVGGKLTQQLVAQGLLTKDMVQQLRREWGEKAPAVGRSAGGRWPREEGGRTDEGGDEDVK